MADVFTKEERSRIMSKVKGRDTKPEKKVRSMLHKLGFRFRINEKKLPGKPDIVLPRHRKVVFVHGCFWHGHKKCKRGSRPTSNVRFWTKKINGNIARDATVRRKLKRAGWKSLVIWTCQIKDEVKLKERLECFMSEGRDEKKDR